MLFQTRAHEKNQIDHIITEQNIYPLARAHCHCTDLIYFSPGLWDHPGPLVAGEGRSHGQDGGA